MSDQSKSIPPEPQQILGALAAAVTTAQADIATLRARLSPLTPDVSAPEWRADLDELALVRLPDLAQLLRPYAARLLRPEELEEVAGHLVAALAILCGLEGRYA